MNHLLAPQLYDFVSRSRLNHRTGLACEGSLRVAAAMLSSAQSDELTATTVVGILGQDEVAAVEALVADIAEEFVVESQIRWRVGSFSVKFSPENGR